MFLENLVFDAADPQRLGLFWEQALGGERLSDGADGFETRLSVEGGPALDLCFQRVPSAPASPRLTLDLSGDGQDQEVQRLLDLGAQRLDGPDVALADPEANPFRVRDDHPDTGPLAVLRLASADADRDTDFWAWLTGWTPTAARSLQHPSQRGPVLQLVPEPSPKGTAKNQLHLDVRLEADDDPEAILAEIGRRGGRELHPDWGQLPWRVFADPSGNEFCVLSHRG